jgi:hypothetical protein
MGGLEPVFLWVIPVRGNSEWALGIWGISDVLL